MSATLRRIILAVLAVGVLITAAGCGNQSPDNARIGVIRGDGWIEGKSGIKGVVCPGKKQFTWNDEFHTYPDSTSQRTFKFNDDEDKDTGPIDNLRTADGYKVTLSGTILFKTRFDCSAEGKKLLKQFDNANAGRPEGERPWEKDEWTGYLLSQFKPILDRNARNVILGFPVKDITSSAALLSDEAKVNLDDVDNKASVAAIEKQLADGLAAELKARLRGDYFTEITVSLGQPTLPDVDGSIAKAQNALAQVAEVRAEKERQREQVQVEKQKKQVNRQKQQGYNACASCARQDELRALPSGITTYAPGGNFAVGGVTK